jgi:hypothetical protein
VPEGVDVREVDLGSELQILGFHTRQRTVQPGTSGWDEDPAVEI